ncbi:MAG TPA: PfkB family carbohydrate kinase [Pirellulales bacterium]|nr:PfkB family carbohydrate kinase [Pirellulales bacterium]
MIVAAGLTPAWQHILRFAQLRVGEVNRAAESHWCASGKVFNVGIALAHLGAECHAVSPLGADVMERVRAEFASFGLQTSLIPQGESTRVCTTLLDDATGAVTELVENARPLATDVLEAVRNEFNLYAPAAEVIVLSGSLPAGTDVAYYRELMQLTTGRVVLDARGPELLATLAHRPFFVKPNREELAHTFGRPLVDQSALLSGMHELIELGAQWVVVTEGARAVWVASAGADYRLAPLRVAKVVNPIGCGDCLAAGLAWGLSLGREPVECVRLGIACAAQNAAALLPGRLDPQQALRQAKDVVVEEIGSGSM